MPFTRRTSFFECSLSQIKKRGEAALFSWARGFRAASPRGGALCAGLWALDWRTCARATTLTFMKNATTFHPASALSGRRPLLAAMILGATSAGLWWVKPSSAAETAVVLPAPTLDQAAQSASATETAVIAGGCFWGVQGVFQHVKGESCPTRCEPGAQGEIPVRNEPGGGLGAAVWRLKGSSPARRVDHRSDGDRHERSASAHAGAGQAGAGGDAGA